MPALGLTNGWDIVYAIRLTDVNRSILQNQAGWPAAASGSSSGATGTYSLAATLKSWRITAASQTGGGTLTLDVDFAPGSTLTKTPASGTPVTTALDGMTATVQLGLAWVAAAGSSRDLLPTDLVVSAITPPGSLDAATESVVRQMLKSSLLGNQTAFKASLATINIADKEAQGTLQWLKPNANISFTVSVPQMSVAPTLENSFLAVLAMTESRQATGLTQEVSANAIPDNDRAAFLIDKRLFFEKMVKPGMAALFSNATADDFELFNDDKGIRNTRDLAFPRLNIPASHAAHERDVSPTIAARNFNFELDGTTLVMRLQDFTFEWQAGVTVKLTHTSRARVSLTSDQRLQLVEDSTTTNSNVIIASWVTWTTVGAGVGLAIAACAVGAAIGAAVEGVAEGAAVEAEETATQTGKAIAMKTISTSLSEESSEAASQAEAESASDALQDIRAVAGGVQSKAGPMPGFFSRNWLKIKAALIAGLPGTVGGAVIANIANILTSQAEGQTADIPTVDAFATEAVSPVSWPDQTAFRLSSVVLNDALQIGGNPFPTTP
jgi:hypothetical protein